MGFFNDLGGLFGLTSQGSNWQAQGISPQQLAQSNAQSAAAIAQQQQLANALSGQGAQGMQSQSALTQALQQQMMGGGPNPAQQALAQQTGANIAQQAALMAGQRGASRSPASMARLAGQQGANIQQQAVGQGALMQAQQQLGAQKQLQDLASGQINQQQQQLANLGQQSLTQQQLNTSMLQNQNLANAGMQQAGMQQAGKGIGGLLGGVGTLLGFADGGQVEKFRPVGTILGSIGDALAGMDVGGQKENPTYKNATVTNVYQNAPKHYNGGEIPNHLKTFHKYYYGGDVVPMMEGGQVPGEPLVNYDTPKNDVVVAKLTPKEIVLPLSVTQSDDPVKESAKFVAAIMEKKGHPKMEESDFKKALKDAIKSRKK